MSDEFSCFEVGELMKRLSSCERTVLAAIGIWLSSHVVVAEDLFVSSYASQTISEFTPTGQQSTFALGLYNPRGLAFDGSGNLFVADSTSGNIYKFAPNGSRSTFASGLALPSGLAFDSKGNLFVAASWNSAIFEFTPAGSRSTFASGWVGGLSLPITPEDVKFDQSGNLLADWSNSSVLEFTPSGTCSIFAAVDNPIALAFDASGNLFESDSGSGNIYEFAPDGSRSTFASGLSPGFLAFDGSDNLFAADINSGNVYKFAPNGARSTFASGLNEPCGLAFAPTPAPEPSTLALLAAGAIGLIAYPWRRRRKQ